MPSNLRSLAGMAVAAELLDVFLHVWPDKTGRDQAMGRARTRMAQIMDSRENGKTELRRNQRAKPFPVEMSYSMSTPRHATVHSPIAEKRNPEKEADVSGLLPGT